MTHLEEKHNVNYLQVFSIFFLSLTILPFLILSYYNNPAYDDFDYAITSIDNGFFKAQSIWYLGWSGRFFSQALLTSINPLIYKSIAGYKIFSVFLTIFFMSGFYFLFKSMFSEKLSSSETLLCSLVITSLYFFRMANVAFGFYWLSSAMIYTFANILTLILFSLLLRFFYEKKLKNITFNKIAIIFLIFAVIGSNEISMVIIVEILIFLLLVNYFYSKKWNLDLVIFTVTSFIASCIVYISPGNNYRQGLITGGHQFFYSLERAVIDTVYSFAYRLLDTPLLLFTILFIPICVRLIKSKDVYGGFYSVNPILSLTMFLLILISCNFTTYLSTNVGPLDRTMNMFYFYFLIGWFYNVLVITNFFHSKLINKQFEIPHYAVWIICLIIVFQYNNNNWVRAAYKDILKGKAEKFDSEHSIRYQFIVSDNSDTCRISPIISECPSTFYFFDITSDPNGKYNRLLAKYFDKKFLVLTRADSLNSN